MKKNLPRVLLLYAILLLSLAAQRVCAQVQTGRSYINVSKNATGGTFEPGDTLEIRSAIAVGNFAAFSITRVRYNDTINGNFTYIPGTLRILTNEGLVFRSFTDAANDDAGMFNATNNTLRINLGNASGAATNTGNATTGGGTINYNDKPSFYGGVCIMVASFRVKINNAIPYNTLLTMPGGAFRFIQSAANITAGFAPNNLMVFQNLGVCPNFVGGNAVIDNNGTFGSGTTQNRSSSAIVPGYTFINFSANQPNDGYYGIANNSSATGATNNGVAYPHASRVFSVWDIIGDHTGAASLTAGNPATTPGTNGGYMAVINASYATSQAIQQTVANLCPSTYYDFSAWFRNICSKCSCDSNGRGALNASYNGPYPPGVKPNLTFQLNGIDYYTTGDLPYTGLWTKKGFTYLTGPAQTSFTFSIRNNSPGGGGNDWAIDDVNLSTCVPDLTMKYTPEFKGCYGTLVDLAATIRCYFPNYTYYKWQKSTDGGSSWFDTGVSGVGSPTLVSGQWEYTAVYPQFVAWQPDSGHRYRTVVATTPANLNNPNCSYSNNANTFLNIIDCGIILNVNLKEFKGEIIRDNTELNWTLVAGNNIDHFELEKSYDGVNFRKLSDVPYYYKNGESVYSYPDLERPAGISFYRLKILDRNGYFIYSPVVPVSNNKIGFELKPFTNPVRNELVLDYLLPADGLVHIRVVDAYGKATILRTTIGKKGWNNSRLVFANTATGIYIVSILYNNTSINKRVVKVH
ncbi:MAG TPA: T9SS type A sorting domain-containing protein [Ferruginibacter sp.]|nr:T9SS type A sorting domain-containing protein [Ferruginibacter sp.]